MINDLEAGVVGRFGGFFSKYIYLFDTLSILVKDMQICLHAYFSRT
jgi:hypothetical protein